MKLGFCTLGVSAMIGAAGCGGAVGGGTDPTPGEPSAITRHDSLTIGSGGTTAPKQTERSRGNGISYHGGPVMLGTVGIYFIWYGNWANDTSTTILPSLIPALSGSSYEHINTTYYNGSNTHVAGTMTLSGQVNDSYSRGSALGDNDVATIVENQIALGALPENKNAVYFVLTSTDVTETSGFCTQYCGWHADYGRADGADIKFAFVGNPAQCPSACEAQTTSPNSNAGADGMASIIAHESEEAISDPDGNAWYDFRGYENADKCAWTFGTTKLASNGSQYNFTGGGLQWLIQRNWVNASGGYCSMSY
jgi:hypothetical protein